MGTKGQSPAGQTTSTQAPLQYMYPYLGTGLQQAGQLLGQGGPNYYPGQQVASFNPLQNQAFGGIQRAANNVGGLNQTNQFDKMLMQGGGSNPYLDQMFNQAAGATQNQLSSEFGGAGRNVDASAAARGQQLNNLATNIYGGNYQNTLQDALQAGNQAQSVYDTRLQGQQQLLGAGNQIQQQGQNQINASQNAYNFNQNQPYANLQRYIGELSGLSPGQQTSNPYFTNPGANALGMGLGIEQLYNGMGSKGSKGGGSGGATGGGNASIAAANGGVPYQ